MLLKISEHLIFLVVLFLIPESFFTFCLKCYENIITKYKNFCEILQRSSTLYCGNKLILELANLEGKLNFGIIKKDFSLPQFKFYTALIQNLLEANRVSGISLMKILPELKVEIQKDIQFERKILKEIHGGYFQFLIIIFTTWGFVFLSQKLVATVVDLKIYFLMITLQILGFSIFYFLMRLIKNKKFKPFSNAFRELYLFMTLTELRKPINTILTESNIQNGALFQAKCFSLLRVRLSSSVERWKNSGHSPKSEAEELIKELWYLQDEHFNDFLKKIQITKFILMALLFLPAYFIYLAGIFKFFMEQ